MAILRPLSGMTISFSVQEHTTINRQISRIELYIILCAMRVGIKIFCARASPDRKH
jgi:hypothetical protein